LQEFFNQIFTGVALCSSNACKNQKRKRQNKTDYLLHAVNPFQLMLCCPTDELRPTDGFISWP
jgi:hypothetical protein